MSSSEFTHFYNQFAPMVYRRCEQLLGNTQKAQEVTQDIFLKLYHKVKIETLKSPASYLWTAATRQCLNCLRQNKYDLLLRQVEVNDIDLCHANSARELLGAVSNVVENQNFIQRVFSLLDQTDIEIYLYRTLDEMTFEEVAQNIGLSLNGTRKRYQRILNKMNDFIQKECSL